jgi:fatty-acyl-CoA synthase
MYFSFRLNGTTTLYDTHPGLMNRCCCPVPTFHIFGEVAGTLNITAPGYFTAFPAILPDTLATMRTIQEEKCTAIIGAPIIFLDLLHHPKRKEYDLTSLVFGLTGAAPVNPILMEQLEREIPIKAMGIAFGQTENTGALTESIFAGDDKQRRLLSVGKAMPRVELKIVDANGRILPIGEEGEVHARGFNIMKGIFSDFYFSYFI